jgi:hypothetical protein
MSSSDPTVTAVQQHMRRRWRIVFLVTLVVLMALLICATSLVLRFVDASTPYFDDQHLEDHFKYASIGTEPEGGLPYRIWQALPILFRKEMGANGYAGFGMLYDERRQGTGSDLPVGVSIRAYRGIDVVWINCGFCHTGSYRMAEGDKRRIVPGMPAHTVDMHRFIRFLFDIAVDERFSAKHLFPAMEQAGGKLGWLDRLYFEYLVIPKVRDGLLLRRARFQPLLEIQPPGGPGRVDSFNLLKTISLNVTKPQMPQSEWVGTNDFPSTFLQRARLVPVSGKCKDPNDPNDTACCPQVIAAHWDGNNACLRERNLSAATGAGVTAETADHRAIGRAATWLLDLKPGASPYQAQLDGARVARGRPIYDRLCKECHGYMDGDSFRFEGAKLGKVTPLAEIGTDPGRLNAFSAEVVAKQGELFKGTPYQFKHFQKTEGYANLPLDGLWARAPYLHNGAVPNLWALLQPPDKRPATFRRGSDVLDARNGGFAAPACTPPSSTEPPDPTCFDTNEPGNGKAGHIYGTAVDPQAGNLSEEDRMDLLEYLKSF